MFCLYFISPPAKLTVGARALAKHHHRDDTASWWGVCTGSESLIPQGNGAKMTAFTIDSRLKINNNNFNILSMLLLTKLRV